MFARQKAILVDGGNAYVGSYKIASEEACGRVVNFGRLVNNRV